MIRPRKSLFMSKAILCLAFVLIPVFLTASAPGAEKKIETSRIIPLTPKFRSYVCYRAGLSYQQQYDYNMAALCFEEALLEDPGNSGARYYLKEAVAAGMDPGEIAPEGDAAAKDKNQRGNRKIPVTREPPADFFRQVAWGMSSKKIQETEGPGTVEIDLFFECTPGKSLVYDRVMYGKDCMVFYIFNDRGLCAAGSYFSFEKKEALQQKEFYLMLRSELSRKIGQPIPGPEAEPARNDANRMSPPQSHDIHITYFMAGKLFVELKSSGGAWSEGGITLMFRDATDAVTKDLYPAVMK